MTDASLPRVDASRVDDITARATRRRGVKPARVCSCTRSSSCWRSAGWSRSARRVYSSFRFFEADTQVNGVFSLPDTLTLDNYREAWNVG